MKIRNELFKEVQARLNSGARKESIYNELKEKYPAAAVERSLAQWPYPEKKIKNRYFNYTLMIITAFFTLLRLLQVIGIARTLESPAPAWFVLASLPVVIYAIILYGLSNYNLIAYLLVMLIGVQNLIGVARTGLNSQNAVMLFAISAVALALAWLQKTRLFPNTSWLLRHKRDSCGKIIF